MSRRRQFLEIDKKLATDDRWSGYFAVQIKDKEHITMLEQRGSVAAVRHKLRDVGL